MPPGARTLIQLTREARQPGWWHSFRDVLPNPYEVYIGLEADAASLRNFEPVVVPPCLANPTRGTGHQLIEPERAWFTPPVRPPWA